MQEGSAPSAQKGYALLVLTSNPGNRSFPCAAVGFFIDAVQKYRGRYCRQRAETTEEMEKEVGDVLLNLASLLYRLGLDPDQLPDYAQRTLEKFQERKEVYRRAMGK